MPLHVEIIPESDTVVFNISLFYCHAMVVTKWNPKVRNNITRNQNSHHKSGQLTANELTPFQMLHSEFRLHVHFGVFKIIPVDN